MDHLQTWPTFPALVRSTPESGHWSGFPECQLWATTGLMHRSKQPLRSTTSSAGRAAKAVGLSPNDCLEIAVPLGHIRSDVRVELDTAP